MPRQTNSLNEALGHAISDKRLEVLRLIARLGSISQAAREACISYKAAWQAIDTLTNLSGVPLVDCTVGGSGGGGARITPQGLELLALADALATARRQVLTGFADGVQLASGLGLRTSMRNQLPCKVVRCEAPSPTDPLVSVEVQTVGGTPLVASLTHESVDLLGLKAGLPVLVLCKATAVRVLPATVRVPGASRHETGVITPTYREPDRSTANQIFGKVARLSRGSQRDEVVLTLSGDLQLVGFADQPNRLRVGSKVCAQVEENAVVLARV